MRAPEYGVPRTRSRERLAAAPLIALAIYLSLFAVLAADILRTVYLNADIASGPVIAQSLASAAGHPEVLLGNYPWFEALGALSLLRILPAHRFLWEATPLILAIGTFALVAHGTWRVAGRNAALITLSVGLAASPATVADLSSWTVHGLTWLHTALLGWLAIWLTSPRSRGKALLVAALVGLACGPALASDLLLIPGGLLPLCLAALAVRRRGGSTVAFDSNTPLLAALAATALAVLGALLTTWALHGIHISGAGTLPIHLVETDRVTHNLRVLWESLAALGNGNVFNVAFSASTLAHAVCAGLAIVALATALSAARAAFTRSATPAERAHGAFWAGTILALIGAFVFSSAPVAAFSGRYLVGVLMGVAALLPLAAHGRTGRAVLNTAVTFFVLVGVMSLARGEMTSNPYRFPSAAEARQVARYATAESASEGYAGYWDSAPITWESNFATQLYPVAICPTGLCPFKLHRIASWYSPRPARRSYLVLDLGVRLASLRAVPPSLRAPVASARIGQLEVFVFSGDIARDFGPPPGRGQG